MKGDNDWQKIPAVLTDRLVVKVSPKAVQIVFGQVGETEVSFHTAVAMARANAEDLAKAILQGLTTESKSRAIKKMTGSGGAIHLGARPQGANGKQFPVCTPLAYCISI